jgi:hypothetical protein
MVKQIRHPGERRRSEMPPAPDVLHISTLLHPYEYSRLVLAVTATVVTFGSVVLFLVVALRGQALLTLLPVLLFLASVTFLIWIFLLVKRATLLGNSIRVSYETLPALQAVIDAVRDRLDYRDRIDVYVTDVVDEPITVDNFLGTRIFILKADILGDLREDFDRPQFEFLFGSAMGALKARHRQFTLVAALLEFQQSLKFLNVFLAPYFRATVYSGDQIGAACSNNIPATVAMMNRLLVGTDLGPSLPPGGVLNQAALVQKGWWPRLAQMTLTQPHLTNRYLNLLGFFGKEYPRETREYLNTLEEPTRNRLEDVIRTSPHWQKRGGSERGRLFALAGLGTALALFLAVALGASFRYLQTPGEPEADTPVPEPTSSVVPMVPEDSPSPPPSLPSMAPLLTLLPGDVKPCDRVEPVPAMSAGAVVAAECSPTVMDTATYIQYESRTDMELAYQYLVPAGLFGTDCSVGPSQESLVDVSSGAEYTLACFSADDGSIAFVWTSTGVSAGSDVHILGMATSSSLTYDDMYLEWENVDPEYPS